MIPASIATSDLLNKIEAEIDKILIEGKREYKLPSLIASNTKLKSKIMKLYQEAGWLVYDITNFSSFEPSCKLTFSINAELLPAEESKLDKQIAKAPKKEKKNASRNSSQ